MANQVQKLSYVDSKLGVSLPGQQTTRVIYDSVVATAAGQQFFEFFTNFAGKNEFQTNLTTNKLDSAESMVIKSVQIIMNSATSNLADHLNLNITVGNQVVLKDFDPSFNCSSRGLSFDRLHSGFNSTTNLEVRLLTEIVIPPQVNFKAELQISNALVAVNDDVTIILKGYGRIFSAGNSF